MTFTSFVIRVFNDRFVASQPFPVMPLLGTTSVDHLEENLGGVEGELFTAAELEYLRCGDSDGAEDSVPPQALL